MQYFTILQEKGGPRKDRYDHGFECSFCRIVHNGRNSEHFPVPKAFSKRKKSLISKLFDEKMKPNNNNWQDKSMVSGLIIYRQRTVLVSLSQKKQKLQTRYRILRSLDFVIRSIPMKRKQ